MEWIVIGEKNEKIFLVSDSTVDARLPKAAFLTIEDKGIKFILRVDESGQDEIYSPSPMIVDMKLPILEQDQVCKNTIHASCVKIISERKDDLISFIKPQQKARRSTQEEVDLAMNSSKIGPKIFPATTNYGENKILTDGKKYITCRLPEDMFWHQTMICGTTGSGKTVASKFLCQYFVEEMEKQGAVLAINVKGTDLLQMDQETVTSNKECLKEWENLEQTPHGVDNYHIYHPASQKIVKNLDINYDKYKKITLSVKDLDPEALNGLLTNVSDAGAQTLPDIFRYWREEVVKEGEDCTFNNFLEFFNSYSDTKNYPTKNIKGDLQDVPLHHGTVSSIKKQLINASNYFDYSNAKILNSDDIVSPGKMSVIDIAWDEKSKKFGSLILRQLLHQIVERKNEGDYSDIPVLILIDEVHMFYGNSESNLALGDLDTICRTGRSLKMGVIFSTQNPTDLPKGISSVVNSKIFFRSDSKNETNTLKKGYAAVSIHDLPQLKLVKFPLSYGGVKEDGKDKK